MPTTELLAGNIKDSFVSRSEHFKKQKQCKQTASLYGDVGQSSLFIM